MPRPCHFTFQGRKLENAIWERHHFPRWGGSFCLSYRCPGNCSCFTPYHVELVQLGARALKKSCFLPPFICVPWVHWHTEASTSRYWCSGNRKIKVKIITTAGRSFFVCFSSSPTPLWNNALNALMCSYIYLWQVYSNLYSVSIRIQWRENKMSEQRALAEASLSHLEAPRLLMKPEEAEGFHHGLGIRWSGFLEEGRGSEGACRSGTLLRRCLTHKAQ